MKEGDTGSRFRLKLVGSDKEIIPDLNDYTITINIQVNDGEVQGGQMTVTDEANGIAEYTLVEGDVPLPGIMEYDVVIEKTGVHLTSETKKKKVEEALST